MATVKYDVKYVALSFQELFAVDRQVFALQLLTDDGKTVVIDFPGQGAKYLRDKMVEALRQRPEMEKWGADFRPS